MFARSAISHLENWYYSKHRKPLIIRGARQVGKTGLVRLFCSLKKLDLLEVNLEVISLSKVEKNGEIEDLIQEIEVKKKQDFTKKTILFLDEIQANPKVLARLRYFFEQKPDIAVIAAGSLLEFILEDHEFSMPVGRVEHLHLGPFSFFEFLQANGDGRIVEAIQEKPIPALIRYFDLLRERLRLYYFVGGMPEAIARYVETKKLSEVRAVHRSILQTYRDDFSKYAKNKSLAKLGQLFDSLPHFLGRKIRYSELMPDEKSTLVRESLHLFKNARILHFCYHSNAKALPLRGLRDEKTYKVYFLDIGLLLYALGVPEEFIFEDLTTHPLVEGLLAEQFIAQHLAYVEGGLESPELFYWVKDKKSESAEVDFLLPLHGKIIPVEVKSGASGKLKSLLSLITSQKGIDQTAAAIRFDLRERESTQTIEEVKFKISQGEKIKTAEFKLYNIPLFGVELVSRLFTKKV